MISEGRNQMSTYNKNVRGVDTKILFQGRDSIRSIEITGNTDLVNVSGDNFGNAVIEVADVKQPIGAGLHLNLGANPTGSYTVPDDNINPVQFNTQLNYSPFLTPNAAQGFIEISRNYDFACLGISGYITVETESAVTTERVLEIVTDSTSATTVLGTIVNNSISVTNKGMLVIPYTVFGSGTLDTGGSRKIIMQYTGLQGDIITGGALSIVLYNL